MLFSLFFSYKIINFRSRYGLAISYDRDTNLRDLDEISDSDGNIHKIDDLKDKSLDFLSRFSLEGQTFIDHYFTITRYISDLENGTNDQLAFPCRLGPEWSRYELGFYGDAQL